MRWFKRLLEYRRLKKTVVDALQGKELFQSEMALARVKAIEAALAERRPVCRHCYNPYVPKQREFAEQFMVRSILMLPSSGPDPMLCDACYETAVTTFNRRATVPGTSNFGQGNLVLQKFG